MKKARNVRTTDEAPPSVAAPSPLNVSHRMFPITRLRRECSFAAVGAESILSPPLPRGRSLCVVGPVHPGRIFPGGGCGPAVADNGAAVGPWGRWVGLTRCAPVASVAAFGGSRWRRPMCAGSAAVPSVIVCGAAVVALGVANCRVARRFGRRAACLQKYRRCVKTERRHSIPSPSP